ncbi:MAG: phenylacetic acid degradation-like protein [Actinomycetia bacterium]|nr:phenylacetic acid degradation-like protein [Actinomycetes bacterium]
MEDTVRDEQRKAQLEIQRATATALESGEHFIKSLGMNDVEIDGVELAVELPVTPRLTNGRGTLQGGLIATLVDMVAGRLAMAGAPTGYNTATNDLTIHFLSPVVEGPARAEGTVLRRGRRTVVVHVDVRDVATDRLAAVSTISFTVLTPLAR